MRCKPSWHLTTLSHQVVRLRDSISCHYAVGTAADTGISSNSCAASFGHAGLKLLLMSPGPEQSDR
jgi:hypothetical protein